MSAPDRQTLPQYPGHGNPFDWILDAAARLRGDPPHRPFEPVLYIAGRRVDMPSRPHRTA